MGPISIIKILQHWPACFFLYGTDKRYSCALDTCKKSSQNFRVSQKKKKKKIWSPVLADMMMHLYTENMIAIRGHVFILQNAKGHLLTSSEDQLFFIKKEDVR